MKKIYIWGVGRHAKTVYEAVDKNQCVVLGFIDNDCTKQGGRWEGCIPVEAPEFLVKNEFDHIFITAEDYQQVLEQCLQLGIGREKLSAFWNPEEDLPYIDSWKKKTVEQEVQIHHLKKEAECYKQRVENYPYEFSGEQEVHIRPAEELLQKILNSGGSLCRFGDGEFEIMRGKARPWFQKTNQNLSFRLKEVLESDEENIMIAVADNFGSLACYTEEAADAIREYLSGGTRKAVLRMLNKQRTYYDAYVTRAYLMYQDKKHAERIFDLFKEIWKDRNVLIVEGRYSRMGVGNDLFSGAKGIKRILCPSEDSYDSYGEIYHAVYKYVRGDELVLVSLGPAATVLAYDLAKNGIQALDIGQLDNEYEWFLRKAARRIEIPGKGVAELGWCRQPGEMETDPVYSEQILTQIMGRKASCATSVS
ncbi:MAG: DUF1792 domain-containing protein [Dorea sp.]|nr:DUF1792 domain-containing protein [Dorea sp.]